MKKISLRIKQLKRYRVKFSTQKNIEFSNIEKVARKLAKAFKIKYIKVNNFNKMQKAIDYIKKTNKPNICEVFVDENQDSLFKQGYAKK